MYECRLAQQAAVMDGRLAGEGDYPEHLNPFREDKNRFTALGRRKLRAVFNLTSWTLFPWRKPKAGEKDRPNNRFLTMTPKLSRHLLERLSKRRPRSASLSPASNPATSTEQRCSYANFRIMPKSSQKKFALNSERERDDGAEKASYLWADRSSAPDLTLSSTSPISEVCGDEDLHGTETRYTRQGAKPKKKRPAPPPPAGDKHVDTTAEMQEPMTSPIPSSLTLKDVDTSVEETPPASPNSKNIRVLVHKMSPGTSPVSNNINNSVLEAPPETSPVSNNINNSVLETPPEILPVSNNINASLHEMSPETLPVSNNINNSVLEAPPETSPISNNINGPLHEMSPEKSPVSNNISISVHEMSPETSPVSNKVNNSALKTPPETSPVSNNINISVFETPPEILQLSRAIIVTAHERSPETLPTPNNVGGSVHEACPEKSPSSMGLSVSVHETIEALTASNIISS